MTHSIGNLFQQLNIHYQIFDTGRHITPLSADVFAQIEAQKRQYPAPYLQHAWLGLLLWETGTTPMSLLWFIRLPLDEQGFLQAPERDQFLQQLLVALNNNLDANRQGEQLAAVLDNNPYVFTPSPERQACLHAYAAQHMGLPASSYYQNAVAYLEGDLQDWENLTVQGIADVARRWQEHKELLAAALRAMPEQPLQQLCLCLENETIDQALTQALLERLNEYLKTDEVSENDADLVAAIIRGMSRSLAIQERQDVLQTVLTHSAANHVEVLAAISGRCQWDLCQPALNVAFLEAASAQTQNTFDNFITEILFDPRTKVHMLANMRTENISDRLQHSLQSFSEKLNNRNPNVLH